jgi:arylsulfatase A-like enzyme
LEDIAPTILQLAALPQARLPVEGRTLVDAAISLPACHGRSLAPLCRNEPMTDWRDAAYSESYSNINDVDPAFWARTIRTDQYRYTLYPAGGGEQLFDLHDDPGEQKNLVRLSELADMRLQLRNRLLEAVVLQDAPHPMRNLVAMGVH